MSASPNDGSAPPGSRDLQQQIRDLSNRGLSGVGLPNRPSGGESSILPVSSSISAMSLGVVPRGGGGVLFPVPGGASVPSGNLDQVGAAASFRTPVGGGSTPVVTRPSLTTSSEPMQTDEPPTPRGVKPEALLTSEDSAPLHEVFFFDGNLDLICGAIVASGGQVCCALRSICRYQHLKKSQAPPGYYIKSFNANGAFYVEPYLPREVAEASPAFMRLYKSGMKLSLAKWSAVFATVLEGKLDDAVVKDVMEEESDDSKTPLTPSLKKPRHGQAGVDIYSLVEQLWRKQAALEGRMGLTEKDGNHGTLCAALRSAHDRISELESLLKVYESRLVAAQADAQAAHDKASLVHSNGVDVKKAVTEFERIAGLKYADIGRVESMETNLNQLMKDVAETNRLVVQLWNAVNGLMAGGPTRVVPPPGDDGATSAEYNSLLKRVVEVEKKQGSLTYSVGGRTFSCQEDATIWCAENMPPDMWECFIGLMHLLNFPDEVTAEASDTVTEQLHATKTGLTTLQIAAITSFKSTYPQQLTGTSKASTTTTGAAGGSSTSGSTTTPSPFRLMASRGQWNAGNELTGLKFTVRASSLNKTNELTEHIRTVLDGKPQGMELCLALLQTAWSAVDWLIAQVDSFYNRLASTTCPDGESCSPAMEKMIWGVVTSSLKAFFDELRTVRVKAVSAHRLPAEQRNGVYLWATMQELAKIEEFRHHGFQEHSRIYHRIVMHLLDTYATKESVKTLTAETSVKASLNGITDRLAEIEKKNVNMNTAIGNVQRDIKALKKNKD